MLLKIKNIITTATKNIKEKIKTTPAFIATEHFQERLLQRFQDEELNLLEKTIEKAFEKAQPGSKVRYTHPAYGITVVGKKMGLNGFELITCWQKEEDAE
ncbi:MAG: hypothetical protein WC141_09365 [Arcobacteraceae bacterium]